MGTQHEPTPGTDPAYDAWLEARTGTAPHDPKPTPVEVVVVEAVHVEDFPARSIVTDQVPVSQVAIRLVPKLRTRARLTLRATADTFIGGAGVTPGTGFLLAANTCLTVEATDTLYGVTLAGNGTVYVLAEVREG